VPGAIPRLEGADEHAAAQLTCRAGRLNLSDGGS
jgi:hypothetical protein